jgi:hypothetical protein
MPNKSTLILCFGLPCDAIHGGGSLVHDYIKTHAERAVPAIIPATRAAEPGQLRLPAPTGAAPQFRESTPGVSQSIRAYWNNPGIDFGSEGLIAETTRNRRSTLVLRRRRRRAASRRRKGGRGLPAPCPFGETEKLYCLMRRRPAKPRPRRPTPRRASVAGSGTPPLFMVYVSTY